MSEWVSDCVGGEWVSEWLCGRGVGEWVSDCVGGEWVGQWLGGWFYPVSASEAICTARTIIFVQLIFLPIRWLLLIARGCRRPRKRESQRESEREYVQLEVLQNLWLRRATPALSITLPSDFVRELSIRPRKDSFSVCGDGYVFTVKLNRKWNLYPCWTVWCCSRAVLIRRNNEKQLNVIDAIWKWHLEFCWSR